MKAEPKVFSVVFDQVSITRIDDSFPLKFYENYQVAVDKKSFFFGAGSNYKVNWKDIEDVQVGDNNLLVMDTKSQRRFECNFASGPIEHWKAFQKFVDRQVVKYKAKNVGPKDALPRATVQRKKASTKPRRMFGTRHAHTAHFSSSSNLWPDDDDDVDENNSINPDPHNSDEQQKEAAEKLVVSLPENSEGTDDELMWDAEEENDIEDPLDITREKMLATKTPPARTLEGRRRLRKRAPVDKSLDDSDSDEDFQSEVDITAPVQDHRVVTPFESSIVGKHDVDDDDGVEEEKEATPKDQKKLYSFFRAKKPAPKVESSVAANTPPKSQGKFVTVKKTFSSSRRSNVRSPPMTQQKSLTPRGNLSPRFPLDSPGDSRPGISSADRRPITSHKDMSKKPYIWSSLEHDIEEANSPQRGASDLSSSTPQKREIKRRKLLDSSNKIAVTSGRLSTGGINRFALKHKSAHITPYQKEVVPDNESPYKGFRNMGNTCYLNASLQMLYTISNFIPAIEGKGGDLVRSITSTARSLLRGTAKLGAASAKAVKDAMDAKTDKFLGFEQRDAHEFLGDLIDNIHEELIGNEECNTSIEETNKPKEVEGGFQAVNEYFRCDIEVCLTCRSCGYSRKKLEIYRHLSLDIDHHKNQGVEGNYASVQKSLEQFFQPEVRELNCEKCKDGKTALQTLRLLNQPKALVLHLKRFVFEEKVISLPGPDGKENQPENGAWRPVELIFRKNTAPIQITDWISLHKFTGTASTDFKAPDRQYAIKSLVYHIGARASSGHYTADAIRTTKLSIAPSPGRSIGNDEQGEKSEWVSYDDSRTSVTSLDEILSNERRQKTAYILLYTLE